MSRQFTIILKNEDLSAIDIYMAIEEYAGDLYTNGEISESLDFEVSALD